MIKNANEVRNEISSLSEPEQDAVMTVIQILGNTTLTDDQKRDTINKMIAEAPTDVQVNLIRSFNQVAQPRLHIHFQIIVKCCLEKSPTND